MLVTTTSSPSPVAAHMKVTKALSNFKDRLLWFGEICVESYALQNGEKRWIAECPIIVLPDSPKFLKSMINSFDHFE